MTRFCLRDGVLLALALLCGCTNARTTNTSRTAKEQLLISNSVDQALDKVDFAPLSGHTVFLDEKYLDCVDKNYVTASIRHRVLNAGATIAPKPEEADIILEARAGAVGTDTRDTFIGVPEIAMPGPLPLTIPEIKLISRSSQTGTAKIGLVAYDAKQRNRLGEGGMTVARSDDNNWFLLGMGPYQDGSVRREMSRSLSLGTQRGNELPATVAFNPPPAFSQPTEEGPFPDDLQRDAGSVRLAGEKKDSSKPLPEPEIQQLNRSLFE